MISRPNAPCSENGPSAVISANAATTDTISTQGAAPRCAKRSDAQVSGGKTRKIRWYRLSVTRTAMTSVAEVTSTSSAHRRARNRPVHAVRAAGTNGTATRMPMASPVHHTTQVCQTSPAGTVPVNSMMRTPSDAPMRVLARAPSRISATASLIRSSSSRKSALLSRTYAHSGAAVLPTVTASARAIDGAPMRLITSAAAAAPTAAQGPRSSRQISATPVGSHRGGMTPAPSARCSPGSAVTP